MTLQVQSYPFQMQFIPIGFSINCRKAKIWNGLFTETTVETEGKKMFAKMHWSNMVSYFTSPFIFLFPFLFFFGYIMAISNQFYQINQWHKYWRNQPVYTRTVTLLHNKSLINSNSTNKSKIVHFSHTKSFDIFSTRYAQQFNKITFRKFASIPLEESLTWKCSSCQPLGSPSSAPQLLQSTASLNFSLHLLLDVNT